MTELPEGSDQATQETILSNILVGIVPEMTKMRFVSKGCEGDEKLYVKYLHARIGDECTVNNGDLWL